MSDFLLLAFLALFSGLCPRAERSTASDEERGKEEPGPPGMRSPAKLGTAGRPPGTFLGGLHFGEPGEIRWVGDTPTVQQVKTHPCAKVRSVAPHEPSLWTELCAVQLYVSQPVLQ
ncbi:Hypothetical protein SMAX5B_018261 [Scophthalmus maximus]|uniref:Uncharacterized protein n=1 Tax=Scophthalmus maximus TaxID=52904 RepID=A0A2U9C8U1_SCOMX|nr:Hypothetical protein SMAX5B_018261 [Scophthalmus maximus]